MFYNFLKTQYRLHKTDPSKGISKEQLHQFVPLRISEEEYQQIINDVDNIS